MKSFSINDINYIFDEPVEYKGLKFYPVKLRDYFQFQIYADCLMLEKNSIPDVKVIQMTYLEFLYNTKNEENKLIEKMYALLQLCTRIENMEFEYGFTEKGKPFFNINRDTYAYTSDDFDHIREIISEQNMLELPDESVQKEVRDEIIRAREIRQRLTGSKTADLEEQILALSLFSGIPLSDIYNMTIRKFMKAIRRANHMIMSNIYLTASMSGMVEFKDKSVLKGWLVDLDENEKFSDITIDLESVQSKLSSSEK